MKRKQALTQSTKELDDDRKDIMTFMERNNELRRAREVEEKQKTKEKGDNEDHLRNLDNEIM